MVKPRKIKVGGAFFYYQVGLESTDCLETNNYRRSIDTLWSPDGSAENARIDGPFVGTYTEQVFEQKETCWLVRQMLKCLHPREEAVLKLRFGIGTDEELTLEDVGSLFGLSHGRIHCIERVALIKLAKHMHEHVLREPDSSDMEKCVLLDKLDTSIRQREPAQKQPPTAKELKIAAERKLQKSEIIPPEEKLLIARLFGWYGVKCLSFDALAQSRGQTTRELAVLVNASMRRFKRLNIWPNPPMYPEK